MTEAKDMTPAQRDKAERAAKRPITMSMAAKLFIRLFAPAYAELAERTDALHARLARLEAAEQRGMTYRGIWSSGDTYHAGDVATYDHQLWFCHATTTARPATTEDWQLMQRGKR